jgi:Ca2+-binding EF-hand superfamily protein
VPDKPLSDFPNGTNSQGEIIPNPNGETMQKFSEDEIQNLREIFDLFDKAKSGSIGFVDLEAIM